MAGYSPGFQSQKQHWCAAACYIIAAVLFTYGFFFRNPGATRFALYTAGFGLTPHAAALLVRWVAQGHGPYMSRYEVLSSDALIGIAMFVVAASRSERLRPLGIIVMHVSFLLIAFGLMTSPALHNLPPSLRSVWLVMHVSFAKLAAGGILLSFAAAILYLKMKKPKNFSFLSFYCSGVGQFYTRSIH